MKRVVAYRLPIELKENHWQLDVQYIIDSGDLLQNVQTRYNKTIYYKNKDWDYMTEVLKRLRKSSNRVLHELEYQLRSDGATPFNARKTAKHLLFGHVIGPRR